MVVFTHYGATDHFESATLAPEKSPGYDTYDMSQHVGDLLTCDLYI
jgi:hypothetical protein